MRLIHKRSFSSYEEIGQMFNSQCKIYSFVLRLENCCQDTVNLQCKLIYITMLWLFLTNLFVKNDVMKIVNKTLLFEIVTDDSFPSLFHLDA